MLRNLKKHLFIESTEGLSIETFNALHTKAAAAFTTLVEEEPIGIRSDVIITGHTFKTNAKQFDYTFKQMLDRDKLVNDQNTWLTQARKHVHQCFHFLEIDKKKSNNLTDNSQNILKDLNLVKKTYQYIITISTQGKNELDEYHHTQLYEELTNTIAYEQKLGRDKNYAKLRIKLFNALLALIALAGIAITAIGILTANPILIFGGGAVASIFGGSALTLAGYQMRDDFKKHEFETKNNRAYKLHENTHLLFNLKKIKALTKTETIEKSDSLKKY